MQIFDRVNFFFVLLLAITVLAPANASLLPTYDAVGIIGMLILAASIFPLRARNWNAIGRAIGLTLVFFSSNATTICWREEDRVLLVFAVLIVAAVQMAVKHFAKSYHDEQKINHGVRIFATIMFASALLFKAPFGIDLLPNLVVLHIICAVFVVVASVIFMRLLPSKCTEKPHLNEVPLVYANMLALFWVIVEVQYLI